MIAPSRRAASSTDEKGVAGADLGRRRLVRGRQAFHRVRDPAAAQPQRVVTPARFGVAAVTVTMQGLVQQDAGEVAGERPAGALAPCMPGASPTISNAGSGSPKAGTGAA
jgi:hypothetical protein